MISCKAGGHDYSKITGSKSVGVKLVVLTILKTSQASDRFGRSLSMKLLFFSLAVLS